jgi:serine/threonine-protein kinase
MIGQVVGNYQITKQIGEGGMCVVYKAVDLIQPGAVALKALRPEFVRQPEIVERFCTEAVTLAKLNHPNIAAVHSFFRQGDDFFIVMEFVPGETLDQVLRQSGAMSCSWATALFCQVLNAIDYAHQLGIIHRDIKPSNIMVTDTELVKVMDFGIARLPGMARRTREGFLIGTLEYMSPEQIRGREIDARSDIYSLGVLLYELLTGRLPFSSESDFELMQLHTEETPKSPREFVPGIPVQMEAVIMRALAKPPEARFQTAGEFRIALESSLLQADAALHNPITEAAAPAMGESETEMNAGFSSGKEPTEMRPNHRAVLPQMKETRQVPATHVQMADERHTTLSIPIQPQATHHRAASIRRLTWQQLIVGGTTMFILISIAVGYVDVRTSPVAPPPPPPIPLPIQPAPLSPDQIAGPPIVQSANLKTTPVTRRTASSAPASTQLTTKPPDASTQPPQASQRASVEDSDHQEARRGNRVGGFFKKVGGGMKKVGTMITGGQKQKGTDRAELDEKKKN